MTIPTHLTNALRNLYHDYKSKEEIRDAPNKDKALLEYLTPVEVIRPRYFDEIFGYDDNGNIIKFVDIVMEKDNVVVAEGKLYDKESKAKYSVIVKYQRQRWRREMDAYNEMAKKVPNYIKVWNNFKVWERPVLVLERLHPLDFSDNEYAVGRDVLKQLLVLHHEVGTIHNDIKPQNIMKRIYPDGHRQYFLIDFDLIATENSEGELIRNGWTRKYICQKPIRHQLTYPICDLIELGYTMQSLYVNRKNRNSENISIRRGFKGNLALYMKEISYLPFSSEYIQDKIYKRLYKILGQ